jgi:hypothetical protein
MRKTAEETLRELAKIFCGFTSNDGTSDPWWAIVENTKKMQRVVLAGPFFSREKATAELESRRYFYGPKPYVYCFSAFANRDWHKAMDMLKPWKPETHADPHP